MNIRRVIGTYFPLDLLLDVNTTEFVTSALRPWHKGTNLLCYDSNALKWIHAMSKHDKRYKTLNYGTVRRLCELWLNKKKQTLTSRTLRTPQQGSNFSNLIHIEPITPRGTFFNNFIKIAMGNVQSLKNIEQTLLHELTELDIDVMLITETWLNKDDIVWLDSCDFNEDTYRLSLLSNWQGRSTGPHTQIHQWCQAGGKGQTRSIEYATLSLTVRKKTITIMGIYHPPPKDKITNGMFINDITDHLTCLLSATTNNVILRDFNMHINNMSSNDVVIFNNTLMALGLTQHVTTSTHAKGITWSHLHWRGNKHQTHFMSIGTLPVRS